MFSYAQDQLTSARLFVVQSFVMDGMFLAPPLFMFAVNEVLRKELRKLLCTREIKNDSMISVAKNYISH